MQLRESASHYISLAPGLRWLCLPQWLFITR
uniref:Uncharacterized protein n=1 Tax=Utricularia reniformis TaxID=192314 RepID=A0A1Y0B2J1_9LAMI|nr:hypothetical protein AEK19_MT1465 [Utricularia reniformis]ART31656.1 hypothetical protein AEK19_MT1465 [Utricularia reniformis]